MSVPEASVDEDACGVFPHDDVGMARKPGIVEPESESVGKEVSADNQLRFGVFGVDCRHVVVTLGWGERIQKNYYYLRFTIYDLRFI